MTVCSQKFPIRKNIVHSTRIHPADLHIYQQGAEFICAVSCFVSNQDQCCRAVTSIVASLVSGTVLPPLVAGFKNT